MYVFDLDKLFEGDVILINVEPRISKLMQEKTGSVFHHAMLYTGGSSHIHSDKGPGVQADNTARMLFEKPDAAIALRLKDSTEKQLLLGKIVDNGRAKVGTEYSFDEAKRTVSDKEKEIFDANRQFCTRFVAQAYADSGLMVVDDPNYCTPSDLINSSCFEIVRDILREANEKDIEFANEKATVLQKQTAINNEILSKVRLISGEDIQTINQISEYLFRHPEKDKDITDVIEQSGYLDLWETDIAKYPYHYEFDLFAKEYSQDKWFDISEELAEVAAGNMHRYERNLIGYNEYHNKLPLNFFKVHVTLYENLVRMTLKMMQVAVKAMKES